MTNFFRFAFVSLVSISFVGCASVPGGGIPDRPALSSDTKASALKGCLIGGGAGALLGVIHGNFSNAIKLGAGGCAAGGLLGGVVGYRTQLKQTRELEAQAKAQGLNPVVMTKDVTPADSKTPEPALERLVLPLDAPDTGAHGNQTKGLLEKAARIAGADISSQHITVTLAGSKSDRAWMRSVMSPLVGGAGSFIEVDAPTPRIELSPVPSIAAVGAR